MSSHLYTIVPAGILVVVVLINGIQRWRRSRAGNLTGLPLPPGPPPLPILGNLLDLPKDKPWLTYDAWAQKYGALL